MHAAAQIDRLKVNGCHDFSHFDLQPINLKGYQR